MKEKSISTFFQFSCRFFFCLLALVSYEGKSQRVWLTKSGKTPPVSSRYVWGKGLETGAIPLLADGTAMLSHSLVQKVDLSCLSHLGS